ncbi:MAG: 50S ribosomal protein L4 [Omnitrophica WOR_2 bacterium RIFCSPLOWO2_12_FULL_50_9]|nr:MAG: 50S ribosomal protein L4 [Omnitrophica WOR_2 bacterium RIFCSPHIGHO2_02_FULL_50_17]OGX42322.1 MAG: 50S ribosomal protein L4 [Omnitrophica WOR_2 bacterium RIFCSPLOWO2_12_FULL_50_9]
MSSLTVLDSQGKKSGSVDLPVDIFGEGVNTDVIHQAVVMYQASLRQGNASTKERGSVSGGGKKPFRQKGTGRARQGSIRSPLWKGGGVVFGPHPRDFGYTVPQKVRKAALRESLNAKHKDEDLVCVDDLKESFDKTKEFAKILKNLSLKGKILALLDGSDASIVRASRNIPFFRLMRSQDVSAYDILRHKKVLVTKTALNNLVERIRQ